METADDKTVRAALNVYAGLKRRLERYRKSHLDVHNACSIRTYYKLKEDPERYAAYLEKRRNYQKQRREKKKAEAEAAAETPASPI